MTWVKEDLMRSLALLCPCSVAHYSGECENFRSQKRYKNPEGAGGGDSQWFNFLVCPVYLLYHEEQLMLHSILSAQGNAGNCLKKLILCFCPTVIGQLKFLSWILGCLNSLELKISSKISSIFFFKILLFISI